MKATIILSEVVLW